MGNNYKVTHQNMFLQKKKIQKRSTKLLWGSKIEIRTETQSNKIRRDYEMQSVCGSGSGCSSKVMDMVDGCTCTPKIFSVTKVTTVTIQHGKERKKVWGGTKIDI